MNKQQRIALAHLSIRLVRTDLYVSRSESEAWALKVLEQRGLARHVGTAVRIIDRDPVTGGVLPLPTQVEATTWEASSVLRSGVLSILTEFDHEISFGSTAEFTPVKGEFYQDDTVVFKNYHPDSPVPTKESGVVVRQATEQDRIANKLTDDQPYYLINHYLGTGTICSYWIPAEALEILFRAARHG